MKTPLHLHEYIDYSEEVEYAKDNNIPIVALESTLISQSQSYPDNFKRALHAQNIVRKNGCVPATIAILDGRIKIGVSDEQLNYIARTGVDKVSTRDIATIIALKRDGATTVASTMMLASLVNIDVFATGGIGGVHYDVADEFDISNDIQALASTSMIVVCSGPKAVLDQKKTIEMLETKGVSVLGYRCDVVPGFFTRTTDIPVDYRIDDPKEFKNILECNRMLNQKQALLVVNPVSEEYAINKSILDYSLNVARVKAKSEGISGKHLTPYLLQAVYEITEGESRKANKQLIFENVAVATQIAAAFK